MKKANANGVTTMIIRKKDVKAVRGLIDQLQQDEIPPKPIKRVVHFTDKELETICKCVAKLAPQIKALAREYERLTDIVEGEKKLSEQDYRWVDAQANKINKILTHAAQRLEVW